MYNFYHGQLYVAQDPLLGADGNGRSVWTRLGDKLIAENLYDAIIFVQLEVGRTEIARWKSDGDLHPRILDAISDLRTERLAITHLLWHQGESDAALGTNKDEYKRMFLDMLSSIRKNGVIATIYTASATKCGCDYGSAAIQEAKEELIDSNKGIYPGPNTDALGFSYRYDFCHFSNDGLEQVADLWLKALKQ